MQSVTDGSARVSGDIAYLPPFPPQSGGQARTLGKGDTPAVGGGVAPQGPITETRTVSEGRTNQRLYLSSLPPQMAKALAVYDTDFDGILSEKDVAAAAADLQHMQSLAENEKEGKIPLDFFPDEVRKLLNEFDENNDGELDVVEIMHGFNALTDERKRRQQLLRIVFGMLLFTTALLIAFALLFGFVLDENTDTDVSSTVLRVKGGEDIVQFASADFAVNENGVIVNRGNPSADCSAGQCTDALKVAQSLQSGTLHSVVPDEHFTELRHMKISSENSWIAFKVMATARYPALGTSSFGSVVVIYTHLGEITLDGDQLSFHESMEGAFSRAGFEVDASRRRLLSQSQITGMFAFLPYAITQGQIQQWTQLIEFHKGLRLAGYTMKSYQVCQGERDIAGGCYLMNDGVDVDHAEWFQAANAKAIVELTNQTLYSIQGQVYTRRNTTKEQFRLQTLLEVQNATHKLTYQEFTNINAQTYPFWCSLTDTASPETVYEELTGSAPTDHANPPTAAVPNGMRSITVDYLGPSTLVDHNGLEQDVLEWKVTSDGAVIAYSQLVNEERMYQLAYGDPPSVVYRFEDVDHDVWSVSTGELPPEIDIDAIWAACDPPGLVKPQKFSHNEIHNRYYPQTLWGLPYSSTGEEYLTQSYASVEELQQYMAGRYAEAGGSALFCKGLEAQAEVSAGVAYQVTQYEPCSGSSETQRPLHLKMVFDGTDDCFKGSGEVHMLRECSSLTNRCSVHSAGSMEVEMDVWRCFDGQIPDYIRAAEGSPGLATVDTISLQTAPSAPALSEFCSLPPVGTEYQLGDMSGLPLHVGEVTVPVVTAAAGQSPALGMEAQLRLQVVMGAAVECGSKQPAESSGKVALRVRYELEGQLQWNTCFSDDGTKTLKPCAAADARKTHPFAFKRFFPSMDGDTCKEDSAGVYHFQCANDDFDCADPIALYPLLDSQNQPVSCIASAR